MSKIVKRMRKTPPSHQMEAIETLGESIGESIGATISETLNEANSLMGENVAFTEGFNASFWPGRRLSLSCYNGQVQIHIREYQTLNGKEYPTKTGACFTPGRLMALWEKVEMID